MDSVLDNPPFVEVSSQSGLPPLYDEPSTLAPSVELVNSGNFNTTESASTTKTPSRPLTPCDPAAISYKDWLKPETPDIPMPDLLEEFGSFIDGTYDLYRAQDIDSHAPPPLQYGQPTGYPLVYLRLQCINAAWPIRGAVHFHPVYDARYSYVPDNLEEHIRRRESMFRVCVAFPLDKPPAGRDTVINDLRFTQDVLHNVYGDEYILGMKFSPGGLKLKVKWVLEWTGELVNEYLTWEQLWGDMLSRGLGVGVIGMRMGDNKGGFEGMHYSDCRWSNAEEKNTRERLEERNRRIEKRKRYMAFYDKDETEVNLDEIPLPEMDDSGGTVYDQRGMDSAVPVGGETCNGLSNSGYQKF